LRLRGEINEEDIRNFWWIMVALAGFFIGGVMGQILSSAFYAKGDVTTPIKVGIIGFTFGMVLKVIGFSAYGLVGIAFGTTLYYLGNAFALYLLLKKDENALSH
jgi:peptidoglycan biosynthesis protein MviN/MurJ (putative lipid II flippase)